MNTYADSLTARRRREHDSHEQTVRISPAWLRRMNTLGTL
jgi:hypothetical protein